MTSISVIVPTLGRQDDLLELVDSLISQTLQPDELVVVDAGKNSSLKDVLNEILKKTPMNSRH